MPAFKIARFSQYWSAHFFAHGACGLIDQRAKVQALITSPPREFIDLDGWSKKDGIEASLTIEKGLL